MSEATALSLNSLLPELLPIATVEGAAKRPFAELLATLEAPLEPLPIEAQAASQAVLPPDVGLRPFPNERIRLGTPPGSPALPPTARPPVSTPAPAAAPSAVAKPTAPALEIESPGPTPPDRTPASLSSAPTLDAGASVPTSPPILPPERPRARGLTTKPFADLATDLLRAGAPTMRKSATGPAAETQTGGEHPAESSEASLEPRQRLGDLLGMKAPAGQALAGPRPATAGARPSVNPSGGPQIHVAAADGERSPALSQNAPIQAANRPLDTMPLLAGPELGDQLGERVGWMLRAEVRTAEIRVYPRDLGNVKINLSMQPDGVEIEIEASSRLMVEELHHAAPRLRALLSEQGLGLTHLEIDQQKPEGQRPGADGSRSRRGTGEAHAAETEEEGSNPGEAASLRTSLPRLVDVFA